MVLVDGVGGGGWGRLSRQRSVGAVIGMRGDWQVCWWRCDGGRGRCLAGRCVSFGVLMAGVVVGGGDGWRCDGVDGVGVAVEAE